MSHREEWEEDGPPSALSAQENRAASARPDTDCVPFRRKRWTPVNGRSIVFSWPSSLKYFLGGKRELEACRNTLCLPSIPPACRESKRGAVWEEEEGSGMELSAVAVPTRGFSRWGACPTTGTLRAQDPAHGPSYRPDPSRMPHPYFGLSSLLSPSHTKSVVSQKHLGLCI